MTTMEATTTNERDRPAGQSFSPSSSRASATRPKASTTRLVSGSWPPRIDEALEEVLAAALHAEQLRQLRQRDRAAPRRP